MYAETCLPAVTDQFGMVLRLGLRSKRGEQGKHDEDEGKATDGVSEDAHG